MMIQLFISNDRLCVRGRFLFNHTDQKVTGWFNFSIELGFSQHSAVTKNMSYLDTVRGLDFNKGPPPQ